MEENDKIRIFICYWDSNGFETIVDMTKWERDCLIATLAGKPMPKSPVSLNSLLLRARFNPQRNPEIWTVNTEYELTEEDMWSYATDSPQALADLIRKNGKKLYGNRYSDPVIK